MVVVVVLLLLLLQLMLLLLQQLQLLLQLLLLLLLQLTVGKDRRLRMESRLGKKTLVVQLHLLPLLQGLAFLLLLLYYS